MIQYADNACVKILYGYLNQHFAYKFLIFLYVQNSFIWSVPFCGLDQNHYIIRYGSKHFWVDPKFLTKRRTRRKWQLKKFWTQIINSGHSGYRVGYTVYWVRLPTTNLFDKLSSSNVAPQHSRKKVLY